MADRIRFEMSGMDIIMAMGRGNPGASEVLLDLMKYSPEIDPQAAMGGFGPVLLLDTFRIYESDIWIVYKDICGQDLVRMMVVLRAIQLGLFNLYDLKSDIVRRSEGRGVAVLTTDRIDGLHVQVCEALDRFRKPEKIDG